MSGKIPALTELTSPMGDIISKQENYELCKSYEGKGVMRENELSKIVM